MHVIVYIGVWKCHVCTSHLCNWMFAAYYTHLVYVKRLCSLGSTQIVYRNEPYAVYRTEPYAVYRTHLDVADRFFCIA